MTSPATIPGVTPANPYGQDFALVLVNGQLDFTPTMQLATGRALLIQSLISRQTTPTGSVIDCPNDCFDVRDWIGEGKTPAQLNQLGTSVTNELLKDQRVLSCQVKATFNYATSQLFLAESFTSGYGPFSFVLAVNNVTGALLLQNLAAPIVTPSGSTGSDWPYR